MTGFSCFILFGLCLIFSSEGKLTAQPKNSVVKPGSTVNLQWDFDDDIKTVLTRTWRFSGDSGSRALALISVDAKPIIRDQSLKIEIKKPATLILKNVNESYNGTYQFTLETDDMRYVSEAVVVIAMTPTVTVECSRSKTIKKGDDITCVCKGKGGNPPAKVTWYKGGKKISETGEEEQSLTLNNVGKNDGGRYKCLAFGHELAQNETTIDLGVQFPPENVRVVLPSEMAERGKPFVIKCEAEANPSPTFKIFLNETEVPAVCGDTHIIYEVNDSHVGSYKCVAANQLGSSSSISRYLRVAVRNTDQPSDTNSSSMSTSMALYISLPIILLVVIIAVILFLRKRAVAKKKTSGGETSGGTENQGKNDETVETGVYTDLHHIREPDHTYMSLNQPL